MCASDGPIPAITDEFECGCPGAALRRNTRPNQRIPPLSNLDHDSSSSTSIDMMPNRPDPYKSWINNSAGLTHPSPNPDHLTQTLYLPDQCIYCGNLSFSPPPFDNDQPPPPLLTPPKYANVVRGDSGSAIPHYFARLADDMGEDGDHGDRGRVEIPLTSGRRANRSMDTLRDWLPLGS